MYIAYDSSQKEKLGSLITDTIKLLNFARVPTVEIDKTSSSANEIITTIETFLTNSNVTNVYLFNYYTDDKLIQEWNIYNTASKPKPIYLVSMPVVPREVIYDTSCDDSYIITENAEVPSSLIDEINAATSKTLANKDFSIQSIILYSMYKYYVTICNEYLNKDFSSGYDVIYFSYNNDKYITIYEKGDDSIKVGLTPGNRLCTYVDYGIVNSGTIKDNNPVEIELEVSYTITDGFPRELICNQLVSDTLYKPDALYILLFTYRNYYHEDDSIRNLSRYDENIISAFEAAIDYYNTEVFILLLILLLL